MWDGIVDEQKDLQWLIDGVQNNTIIGVTDGLYDRKMALNMSAAGWLVCCTSSEKILRANFYEKSKSASSYRGELLGLVALYTFPYAICNFHNTLSTTPKICCDNIFALRPFCACSSTVEGRRCCRSIFSVLWTMCCESYRWHIRMCGEPPGQVVLLYRSWHFLISCRS